MAPLIHLLVLFALSTTLLASPHLSRNVYNHAHRAIAPPSLDIAPPSHPLPKRKRSLNKRCLTRPVSNSTTSAYPATASSQPTTVPINVAPVPSLASSALPSAPADTTSSPLAAASAYAPQQPTTPTPSPTTSTPAPAQTSSSSSSSSGEPSYMIGTQSGQGTFYATGLGACGITNTDSQAIAAVSEDLFDTYPGYDGVNPNTNPVCGKTITASYQGKSVTVTVTDRCTGCSLTDLDFSPSAFTTLADESLGRIDISWLWN